jgi:uncharacterized protein YjgD (DUF1641 family)
MATPIPLEIAPRDPREELRARLENAPLDHAEALLATYEVLQGLHDKGMLDFLRGAIGSSEQTLTMLVDATKSPEAVRGIRNAVLLAKLLSAVDPEMLRGKGVEPLSLLQLFKKLNSADTRRALTVLTCALESAGKTLNG